MVFGFAGLMLVFFVGGFLGRYPFPPEVQGFMFVGLAMFPLAIFSILQNAIIADIAEADGVRLE